MFTLKVDDEIELALPTAASIERACEVVRENYEHLHEWMPWANENMTSDNIRDFYRTTLAKFAADGDEIALQIIYNGDVVGGTGFHNIDRRNRSAEIGYWLAKAATGKGIVTRSVVGQLDHAFGEMNLNRIAIKCAPGNKKSRAIPERLGFREDGVEREAGWLHTRFVDHIVYSMLAGEWREKLRIKIKK